MAFAELTELWLGRQELLRPTYPGMLRSIRRNLYNLVLVVNPTDRSARSILRLAESFVVHQARHFQP